AAGWWAAEPRCGSGRTWGTSGSAVGAVSVVAVSEALSTSTMGGRGSSEPRWFRVRRSSPTRSRVATTTETGDRVVSGMAVFLLHEHGVGRQTLPPGCVLVHVVGEGAPQPFFQTDGRRPAESLLRTGDVGPAVVRVVLGAVHENDLGSGLGEVPDEVGQVEHTGSAFGGPSGVGQVWGHRSRHRR